MYSRRFSPCGTLFTACYDAGWDHGVPGALQSLRDTLYCLLGAIRPFGTLFTTVIIVRSETLLLLQYSRSGGSIYPQKRQRLAAFFINILFQSKDNVKKN
jgi:hypothetical protein